MPWNSPSASNFLTYLADFDLIYGWPQKIHFDCEIGKKSNIAIWGNLTFYHLFTMSLVSKWLFDRLHYHCHMPLGLTKCSDKVVLLIHTWFLIENDSPLFIRYTISYHSVCLSSKNCNFTRVLNVNSRDYQ